MLGLLVTDTVIVSANCELLWLTDTVDERELLRGAENDTDSEGVASLVSVPAVSDTVAVCDGDSVSLCVGFGLSLKVVELLGVNGVYVCLVMVVTDSVNSAERLRSVGDSVKLCELSGVIEVLCDDEMDISSDWDSDVEDETLFVSVWDFESDDEAKTVLDRDVVAVSE